MVVIVVFGIPIGYNIISNIEDTRARNTITQYDKIDQKILNCIPINTIYDIFCVVIGVIVAVVDGR